MGAAAVAGTGTTPAAGLPGNTSGSGLATREDSDGWTVGALNGCRDSGCWTGSGPSYLAPDRAAGSGPGRGPSSCQTLENRGRVTARHSTGIRGLVT
jgi:hypothetical protein